MTEQDIQVYEPQEVAAAGPLQRLEQEAAAMELAYKIAKGLSHSGMVPEHFQFNAKPRGCTDIRGEAAIYDLAAAILYGAELGMSAATSAQNIFIVKGKPAVYARTMAAQVRRAGFRMEEVEASDERVVWRAERDGHWASSEWTIERAKQAGYTANEKYTSNPQEMLRAKCIAEVCRIQYQDVLLGMSYSVEELQLDNVTVQRVVRRDAPGVARGAAALRELAEKAAQEAPAPPAPEAPPGEQSTTEVVLASNDQVKTIEKLYKEAGVTGPALLDEITQFLQLDKRLAGLPDLTREDAEELLEVLQPPTT